jgi:large subunit ribosomal protein L17
MPQPRKAPRFGGSPSHHDMILANLATELVRHGRIRTTHAKAKAVQPLAERMITFAKRGDVHSRRQVLRVIRDRDVVHKLFADVGPAFSERNGGYTRVLRLDPRKGDAAPMALIELVEGVTAAGEGALEEAPRRRWSLRRARGTLSVTGRERAEDRLAAADRGEQPELAEATGEGAAEEAEPTRPRPDAEEERPQVTAEEVEARLAAEEEEASAGEAAEEAEGEEAEAPGDEEGERS